MGVEAPAIRMRTWLVKRFDAALVAKQVIGLAGVEPVTGQLIQSLNYATVFMRHNQVQKAGHAAHGTIAMKQCFIAIHRRFELNRSTVTTTMNGFLGLIF